MYIKTIRIIEPQMMKGEIKMCAILWDYEEDETPDLLPPIPEPDGYQAEDFFAMLALSQQTTED